MELEKKKYKKDEVEKIILSLTLEYEKRLSEQKERLVELDAEVKNLSASLLECKKNENTISQSIKSAQKTAEEILSKANEQYEAELQSLKLFSAKWRNYFLYIAKKYPKYTSVESAKQLFDKLVALSFSKESGKNVVNKLNAEFDKIINVKDGKFNPQAKIEDYIVATSDNGFNLDEVLNPGDIKLEDICKELGLLEE